MADQISQTTDLDELVGTYYDKVLLERMTPQLYYAKDADTKPLPTHGGTTIQWARLKQMSAFATLTEGTAPDRTQGTVSSISATISQYGQWSQITDVLEVQAFDPLIVLGALGLPLKAATAQTIRRPDGKEYVVLGSARKMLGDERINYAERWKGLWMVCDSKADTGTPIIRELAWLQQCEVVSPGRCTERLRAG